MLIGSHSIIYSKDSDADRAFLRDTLPCGGKLGVYEPPHARPKPMRAAKAAKKTTRR